MSQEDNYQEFFILKFIEYIDKLEYNFYINEFIKQILHGCAFIVHFIPYIIYRKFIKWQYNWKNIFSFHLQSIFSFMIALIDVPNMIVLVISLIVYKNNAGELIFIYCLQKLQQTHDNYIITTRSNNANEQLNNNITILKNRIEKLETNKTSLTNALNINTENLKELNDAVLQFIN